MRDLSFKTFQQTQSSLVSRKGYQAMRYEWDEAKRQANVEKHGLDFLDAPLVLEAEEKAVFPARYEQEERFKAIARVGETHLVVVYTKRDEVTRIISFRPAKRKERRRYEDAGQHR